MLAESRDELRQVPMFADLSTDTLDKLASSALRQTCPPQTLLCRQGELPDFLHILLDGTVGFVATSPMQREAVVEVLEPVDLFMPAAVLARVPYLVSVRVLTSARIMMVPAEVFRERAANDARLADAVIHFLSRQYQSVVHQVMDLKLLTATQRLGCYLLTLADQSGHDNHGVTVALPCEKKVTAGLLGMTPESFARALATLRRYGVESHGRNIVLSDVSGLRAYCLPNGSTDTPPAD